MRLYLCLFFSLALHQRTKAQHSARQAWCSPAVALCMCCQYNLEGHLIYFTDRKVMHFRLFWWKKCPTDVLLFQQLCIGGFVFCVFFLVCSSHKDLVCTIIGNGIFAGSTWFSGGQVRTGCSWEGCEWTGCRNSMLCIRAAVGQALWPRVRHWALPATCQPDLVGDLFGDWHLLWSCHLFRSNWWFSCSTEVALPLFVDLYITSGGWGSHA